MNKKLSLGEAEKIAMYDYNIGIAYAISELEKMGFNCSYYWQKMDDIDEDNLNIKTRDELFKKLHIYKIMQKAYNNIWR